MGNTNENVPHSNRRKRKKRGGFLSSIIFLIALVVFCVSAFQIIKIGKGYLEGRREYEKIRDLAVEGEEPEGGFRVNFDKLRKTNPDTVGWIRFYPEPEIINYPVVQGKDNQQYLHQTFSEGENTLGTIFLKVENKKDFGDRNSVLYGHRMRDGSMFRHLQDYDDREFWEKNPYFYIYTPDGRELTYHVYSAGEVEDMTDTYRTEFADDEEFQDFLDMTKKAALYDTGVEVGTDDKIVTLSTCTSASDIHRFVVRGVLEKSVQLKEE